MKPRSLPSSTADPQLGFAPNKAPFPYADYVQAQNKLHEALRSGPRFYALLWASSGMGKTCLLRDLDSSLDRHRHQLIYISCAKASMVGIVHFLAQKLHVTARRSYLQTVLVLSETIRAQPAQLLLCIDEADQMQLPTLQEIRMLLEPDLGTEPLATIILSGLPAVVQNLQAPSLFPLKRRFTTRCALSGLRRDELDPFLDHRFGAAEAQRLPSSVRDELFERTQATPALIDAVISRLLAQKSGPLSPEDVRAALDAQGL